MNFIIFQLNFSHSWWQYYQWQQQELKKKANYMISNFLLFMKVFIFLFSFRFHLCRIKCCASLMCWSCMKKMSNRFSLANKLIGPFNSVERWRKEEEEKNAGKKSMTIGGILSLFPLSSSIQSLGIYHFGNGEFGAFLLRILSLILRNALSMQFMGVRRLQCTQIHTDAGR